VVIRIEKAVGREPGVEKVAVSPCARAGAHRVGPKHGAPRCCCRLEDIAYTVSDAQAPAVRRRRGAIGARRAVRGRAAAEHVSAALVHQPAQIR